MYLPEGGGKAKVRRKLSAGRRATGSPTAMGAKLDEMLFKGCKSWHKVWLVHDWTTTHLGGET